MSQNLEIIIFSAFLVINLVMGLYFSKGVNTIKEYAVGDRNFSTATIVATLVATWITGEFFFGDIVENYNNGMYMMWAGVIGPEGGEKGGKIVVQGSPQAVAACSQSHTGFYLKQYLPKTGSV